MTDDYMDDYEVYNEETGECLGSVELKEGARSTIDDMPEALEINGVVYTAQF